MAIRVIKVGGSLLDLPDLPARLRQLLRHLPGAENVLLCGGGPLADVMRRYDDTFRLPADVAHWLAVRAMSINAALLSHLLPEMPLLAEIRVATLVPASAGAAAVILDPETILRQDEPTVAGPRLPYDWSATSDSIAARIAQMLDARQLYLLKSVCLLKSVSTSADNLQQLASQGVLDAAFPTHAAGLEVKLINLRAQMQEFPI